MKPQQIPRSPVSFPVHVKRLPKNGFPVLIEADEKQRGRLADAHGVLAVDRFRAQLVVSDWKRNAVRVVGTVDADIVQECAVTLDPLRAEVAEKVDAVFVPEDSELARPDFANGEILISSDGPDVPETFSGDWIDVGALAEEFFGLAIDPYPRKEGAAPLGPAAPEGRQPPLARFLKAADENQLNCALRSDCAGRGKKYLRRLGSAG